MRTRGAKKVKAYIAIFLFVISVLAGSGMEVNAKSIAALTSYSVELYPGERCRPVFAYDPGNFIFEKFWTSKNSEIVTVDTKNSHLVAKRPGKTYVWCRIKKGKAKQTIKYNVTVVKLTDAEKKKVKANYKVVHDSLSIAKNTFSYAEVKDSRDNAKTLYVKWKTKDSKIASNHGEYDRIYGNELGETEAYCYLHGIRFSCHVSVAEESTNIYANYDRTKDLSKEADKILKKIIKPAMSEEEKCRAIFDWMCDNIIYDRDSDGSAYEALIRQVTKCEGFANGFRYLCKKVGLPCYKITGMANGAGEWDGHAWNKVKVDGNWYMIDVTWGENMEDPIERYKWYLQSSDDMSYDHIIKEKDMNCGGPLEYQPIKDMGIPIFRDLDSAIAYRKSNERADGLWNDKHFFLISADGCLGGDILDSIGSGVVSGKDNGHKWWISW